MSGDVTGEQHTDTERRDLPGECIASRAWGLYHKRRVNGRVRYYRWFARWGYRRVPFCITPWASKLSDRLAEREATRYLEDDAT
jgi:hypothetical protein